jgi:phage/plasmid-like protein (TIGR03299 family)
MSHYFESGFSVREPAWHGLAVILDDYPGRKEAMEIAGHNFKVKERRINISGVSDTANWKALVHSKNNTLLAVVRKSYQVVQNEVLWDIVDTLLDQENVKYETAGVLKQGTVLWVLARLDEPVTIPGDNSPIYPYCNVTTTHDGSGGIKAMATSVRVVCWNTASAADLQAKKSGLYYTFRHTKNVMSRIEDAKAALSLTRHQHAEFLELANELAAISVTEDNVKDFLARFIPEPSADVLSDRVKKNIADSRFQVYELLDGPTISEAHRRTGYGLWQAGIEFVDHLRGFHNPETYFNRTMLHPMPIKKKIAKLVKDIAA